MQSMTTIHQNLTHLIVVLLVVTTHAVAQNNGVTPSETPITNEYRVTNITSKPVSDKIVLFTYSGYTNAPDKEFRSFYGSPPNMIYIVRPWMEILVGLVVVYNDNKRTSDSWEFRPITGVKFYVPNDRKLYIYNLTRFEYRMITQDNNWQKIPRIRNRFGIEVPFTNMKKAWKRKTFYALADIEPIFRLDEKRLQVLRLRGGIGYVFNRNWRAEIIYHQELSETPTQPFDHTGNIWRLNIKLSLPRRGLRYPPPIDID